MTPGLFFQHTDDSVKAVLKLVIEILVFFTTLFHVWKFFKDSAFVRLMLTRTYSWWGITVTYTLFFCVYPPIGHVGLCLLSLMCFREIVKRSSSFKISKGLLSVCYSVIVIQFLATSLVPDISALFVIPFLGMSLVTIYCMLFEGIEAAVKLSPYLVWMMTLTSSGFAHLSYLYALQMTSRSFEAQGLLIYFIFLTQFNDVLQFIWGTICGRHQISPHISPGKTWEGLIGAVCTTMLIAYGLRYVTHFNVWQCLLVGFLSSIFGFWGDLVISTLKRSFHVKDMGTVIPGHGGILDRVDSILISSLVYFYLAYFWILK